MQVKTYLAEFLGTFWLVLGGCGAAMLAATFPDVGIGLVGVSLAFGLTVLTIAYSLGHVSGAHLNPAVTIGFWASGSISADKVLPYIACQIAGAILGASVLYIIVTGNGSSIGDFAANGYAEHSPGKYSMVAAIVTEFVMTFMFMFIICPIAGAALAGFIARILRREKTVTTIKSVERMEVEVQL